MNPQVSSTESSTTRNRQARASIAGRLFQYAFSGPNALDIPADSVTPAYNRLRDQLFPNLAVPNRLVSSEHSHHVNAGPVPVSIRRQTEAHYRRLRNRDVAHLHPSFRSKTVCALDCLFCSNCICKRGMKAILLADTSVMIINQVELYSTDDVSRGCVQLVGEDYVTQNCQCRIRDVACLKCGNVVGYHVTNPCEICLASCNNGHFWMFLSDTVKASERMDYTGKKRLLWANLDSQTPEDLIAR